MHRVAWDLRYPDPPTLNYGYYGNLLDYREYTLNWHALPGQTPRRRSSGRWSCPGTYTREADGGRPELRAAVHGRRRSARHRSRSRRSTRSSSCSSAWSRGITATYDAFNYIQQLRAALAAREGRAASVRPADRGARRRSTRRWRRSQSGPDGTRHRASRPGPPPQRSARRRRGSRRRASSRASTRRAGDRRVARGAANAAGDECVVAEVGAASGAGVREVGKSGVTPSRRRAGPRSLARRRRT